jgi:hypothetical protein
MRIKRPEEVGVVVVSRTPGPGFVSVFASGASPFDAVSPPGGGVEGAENAGKVCYTGSWWGGSFLKIPHKGKGFSTFLGFSLHLEAAVTLATKTLHASCRQGLSHIG